MRLLTPERGVLTAFAFGGLRSRRRFSGCLEPLSRVLFKIVRQRGAGYYFLREGSLLDRFSGLHRDPGRLGMAVNCTKFVEAAHAGSDDSRAVYSLLTRTLAALEDEGRIPGHLPLFFRSRLACEYGYRPELGICSACGGSVLSGDRAELSLSRGAVRCSSCDFLRDGYVVKPQVLACMQQVLDSDPSQWSDLSRRWEGALRQSCLLLERFVEYHLALVWDAGRFRPAGSVAG